MKPARIAAALICTSVAGACGAPAGGDGLVVLGAASTRVINGELEALADTPLTFINAGSAALVQQLADGAPGGVLITADKKNMDDAENAGLVNDPREVAHNTMVIAVPAGNPAGIESAADVAREGVNLVLCDENVPCGAVARTLLDANGITVKPASREHNVTDTLGKVTSGEADAAVVYRTDAIAAGEAVETVEIPFAEDHPNSLYAAVVSASTRPDEAAALVALLTSAPMAAVWQDHGFTPAADAAK
ncbi:molybdate ABC transporter substrate-binding protein [Corynebacterium sp. Q4381]|uniref:molybdate ABC transporter substrate-binding protein n=1 Tax=Corynebacterium sp. Marseille-Q4381 TaxID=3121597 RepID=UPI002FE6B1B9